MKLTNKILRRSCKPAQFDRPGRNQWLCQQMRQFMIDRDGIGLAANQIGLDVRLFVMCIDGRTKYCFNPEILGAGADSAIMVEGCLSFPKKQCTIQRPEQISVRYQDPEGCWIQEDMFGLESRCFQHELDHLNGVTMWDRLEEQHAEQP